MIFSGYYNVLFFFKLVHFYDDMTRKFQKVKSGDTVANVLPEKFYPYQSLVLDIDFLLTLTDTSV